MAPFPRLRRFPAGEGARVPAKRDLPSRARRTPTPRGWSGVAASAAADHIHDVGLPPAVDGVAAAHPRGARPPLGLGQLSRRAVGDTPGLGRAPRAAGRGHHRRRVPPRPPPLLCCPVGSPARCCLWPAVTRCGGGGSGDGGNGGGGGGGGGRDSPPSHQWKGVRGGGRRGAAPLAMAVGTAAVLPAGGGAKAGASGGRRGRYGSPRLMGATTDALRVGRRRRASHRRRRRACRPLFLAPQPQTRVAAASRCIPPQQVAPQWGLAAFPHRRCRRGGDPPPPLAPVTDTQRGGCACPGALGGGARRPAQTPARDHPMQRSGAKTGIHDKPVFACFFATTKKLGPAQCPQTQDP